MYKKYDFVYKFKVNKKEYSVVINANSTTIKYRLDNKNGEKLFWFKKPSHHTGIDINKIVNDCRKFLKKEKK